MKIRQATDMDLPFIYELIEIPLFGNNEMFDSLCSIIPLILYEAGSLKRLFAI